MSKTNAVIQLTKSLSPPFNEIKRGIADYKKAHKGQTELELANGYGNNICWKYASVGFASALPSVIPGLGTATQVAIESGAITTDVALMLRFMGTMTTGIGIIFERDVETSFNQDYIKVLGLWCGVLKAAEQASRRIATKVAVAQFKKVPGKIFLKINQKVGTTIVTKYGTKRGGIALGRLIPFGVGASIGGVYNLVVMKSFKNKAIQFFSGGKNSTLIMMNASQDLS